jgi:hypothetical protein
MLIKKGSLVIVIVIIGNAIDIKNISCSNGFHNARPSFVDFEIMHIENSEMNMEGRKQATNL